MISRNNKSQAEIYRPFADLLQQQLNSLHEIENITLDGEIVCVGPNLQPLPMQRLLKQRGKTQLLEDTKMVFYAFDVLEYNNN